VDETGLPGLADCDGGFLNNASIQSPAGSEDEERTIHPSKPLKFDIQTVEIVRDARTPELFLSDRDANSPGYVLQGGSLLHY